MEYNVDYFINKFKNTKDDLWCTGKFRDGMAACANGWCGITEYYRDKEIVIGATEESRGLREVFKALYFEGIHDTSFYHSNVAAHINNGTHPNYRQSTPKERIIAALYDIKKMQEQDNAGKGIAKEAPESEVKEKIRYVSVPTSITEQTAELILS